MSVFSISAQALNVNADIVDADTIQISVNDGNIGSSVALNLRDLGLNNDTQYISVSAINLSGAQSDAVQVRNPLHTPIQGGIPITGGMPANTANNVQGGIPITGGMNENEAVVSGTIANDNIGLRPLTPSGTGTVIDNVTDGDSKEFFTIFTEDGNEFFLVIDRQRSQDNVYLLNTVTEQDLMSLARQTGNEITPNIPIVTMPTDVDENTEPLTTTEPQNQGDGNGTIIFIVILIVAVGGVGYYFKIVKPKQGVGTDNFDNEEDESYEDYDGEDEQYEFDTETSETHDNKASNDDDVSEEGGDNE